MCSCSPKLNCPPPAMGKWSLRNNSGVNYNFQGCYIVDRLGLPKLVNSKSRVSPSKSPSVLPREKAASKSRSFPPPASVLAWWLAGLGRNVTKILVRVKRLSGRTIFIVVRPCKFYKCNQCIPASFFP